MCKDALLYIVMKYTNIIFQQHGSVFLKILARYVKRLNSIQDRIKVFRMNLYGDATSVVILVQTELPAPN